MIYETFYFPLLLVVLVSSCLHLFFRDILGFGSDDLIFSYWLCVIKTEDRDTDAVIMCVHAY